MQTEAKTDTVWQTLWPTMFQNHAPLTLRGGGG